MLAPNVDKNKGSGNKKLATAIIAGASSLLGTGLSAWNTARVNRSNQRSVDRQNQFAVQLRDYDNWYNSPVQQMKRFADAGLNPNLIYGSMDGSSSTAPSLTVPSTDVGFDMSSLATSGSQIASMLQQDEYLNAQTRNIELQNLLLAKDVGNKEKQVELENQKLQEEINNLRASYEKIMEETQSIFIDNVYKPDQYEEGLNLIREQIEGLKKDNKKKDVDYDLALAALDLSYLQITRAQLENAILSEDLKFKKKYYEKELEKIDVEIKKLSNDSDAVELANIITRRDFNISVHQDDVYDINGNVRPGHETDARIWRGVSIIEKVFDKVIPKLFRFGK